MARMVGVLARPGRRWFAILVIFGVMTAGVAYWIRSSSPWLAVDPVPGPLPEGSLLLGFQRDFAFIETLPDGRRKFHRTAGSIARIEPADGSHRVVLDRFAHRIRVSPDGRTLAITSDGEEVWLMPVDGGEAEAVPNLVGYPVWSPDGSALLCTIVQQTGGRDPAHIGNKGTWRVELKGMARSRLDLPDTEWVEDWSGDGRWLLTASSRDWTPDRFGFDLYRMAPDGSDSVRLTTDGANIGGRFSPGGKRLAYTHFDSGGGSVWIVDADGANTRKLVGGVDQGTRPTWSPDGKSLAIKGTRTEAFVIDADGSNRRPIGLHWEARRPMFALPKALGGSMTDPRWIGGIEWARLPTDPGR